MSLITLNHDSEVDELYMASVEAISETFQDEVEIPKELGLALVATSPSAESIAGIESVVLSLDSMLRTQLATLSTEDLTDNDIQMRTQAATLSAIASSNIPAVLKQSIVPNTSTEDIHVINRVTDAISKRELATECFKNRVDDNMQTHSCMFGLRAAGPDEFVRTVAPLILINPNESGIRCTAEIIYIQDDAQHSTSGDAIKWNRRTLVQAMLDDSILGNRTARIIPIVRSGGSEPSVNKFVPDAEIAFEDVEAFGETVSSGVLKTATEVDFIGIGQTDSMLTAGPATSSDALDQVGTLSNLYVNFGGQKWLNIPTSSQSTSAFFPSRTGEATELTLNFNTSSVLVHEDTPLTDGTALKALIPELDSANNGGKEYKVYLRVSASGDADVLSGTVIVSGTRLRVEAIYDAANDNAVVPLDAGDGLVIVEAIQGTSDPVGGCRIQGFKAEFYLSNRNHKRRGQLLGKLEYTEEVYVPLLEPLTCPREVGSPRDAADVDTLVSGLHVAMNNAAVNMLLNFENTLRDHAENGVPGVKPDVLGIARYIVTPTLTGTPIDVRATVMGMNSAGRFADISAVIVDAIRNAVYTMWHGSGMEEALIATGSTGRKQRIVIAADTRLAQYLQTLGDDRLLGDLFDFKVVLTNNLKFRGRVMAFPSNPVVNNQPDCLRFAHTAYSPESVMNLDVPRNGGVENELSVYPRFRMFVCNPSLVSLTFTNVEAAYAPVGGEFV